MKRTIRQIIAGLLAVAMIIPFPAHADEYDLAEGNVQFDFLSSQTPNLYFSNNQNQPQNSVESIFLIRLLYIGCSLYYSSLS